MSRGDVLTFTGELFAGGERVGMRKAFHHKSDTELFIRVDAVGPDGDRTRLQEELCTRQGDD